MERYFTKNQIEELRARLVGNGMKDTDFPEATTFSSSDSVAIVQDGKNKKLSAVKLVEEVAKKVFEPGAGLEKDADNNLAIKIGSKQSDTVRLAATKQTGLSAEIDTATNDKLGVVKIGSRLSITKDGTLSADETAVDDETIEYKTTALTKKLAVKAVPVEKVTGLEEALNKKISKLTINGDAVATKKGDNTTMELNLGDCLAFDKDKSILFTVWSTDDSSDSEIHTELEPNNN